MCVDVTFCKMKLVSEFCQLAPHGKVTSNLIHHKHEGKPES